VVIGILIALQINNWNENIKLHKQGIIYLNNLKNDINSQIEMIEIYIDFEDITIEHTRDIIKHYELNEAEGNKKTVSW
jgi:hypothetical protein